MVTLAHVHVGGHLHAGAAGADHAFDQLLHLPADAVLDRRAGVVGDLAGGGVGVAAAQEAGVLVDDGHPVGLEVGDRARDEVLQRPHLVGRGLATLDSDDHRGGGLGVIVLEKLVFGQHELHAGECHPVQRADGAGKFPLERPLAVEVLNEIGLAEGAGVVEYLVADRARGRQAFRRQHEPGRCDLVARHHDGRAVTLGVVFDAGLIQRLADRGRFLQVKVGVEQRFRLTAHVQDKREERRRHAGRNADDRRQAPNTEALQSV